LRASINTNVYDLKYYLFDSTNIRYNPHNHSAASSKNLSNSSSSWKQSISSLVELVDSTGETEIGSISSMLGIVFFEDKEVQGSGWRASLVERTGAGRLCVAPAIFTAGMILMVTNPK